MTARYPLGHPPLKTINVNSKTQISNSLIVFMIIAGVLASTEDKLPAQSTSAKTPIRSQHAATSDLVERLDRTIHVDEADRSMVVSDSAAASRIGTSVLEQGGNAVDAAIATAFALAVSWPDAGNIGGGGFMMIRPSNGQEPVCIDYRETAPMSMKADSFQRSDTTFSHKAVGIPGTVRGLALAHQEYGQLAWRDLVMPAAKLAKAGVQVDRPLADSLNTVLSEKRVQEQSLFAEFRRVFSHPENRKWRPGDQLIQPDLSVTLKEIAEQGPDAFYTGSISQKIVEEMKRGNGQITHQDLHRYSAKKRSVITGTYRGYTILGAPPPSSGGTCIIEALNILECFDLGKHPRHSALTIHLMAEAMRRAFADRAKHLGDPDFVPIPAHLIEKQYARSLAKEIDLKQATPSRELGPPLRERNESPDTTHFSIVDSDGMAVSNTYTLEATWGSRIVVGNAGFVLNNEMGDFNWFPGETNRYGRVGTEPNQLQGGKRMLSSQCPVIIERDGDLVMVTGSPGGRTIINTVLCILINLIDYEQSPSEVISSMRMHHQWFPDRILLEKIESPPHSEVAERLTKMGHVVENRPAQGSAHTIIADQQSRSLVGISDFRRSGRPSAKRSNEIAKWHFNQPSGVTLTELTKYNPDTLPWLSSARGAITTGFDTLRISESINPPDTKDRREISLNEPKLETAFVKIPPVQEGDSRQGLILEIKIDNLNFQGRDRSESIGFSMSHQSNDSRQIPVTLFLGRRENSVLSLWLDTGEEASESITLQSESEPNLPFLIQIRNDFATQKITVLTRKSNDELWTLHTTITNSSTMGANSVGLSWDSNSFETGDWIDIDRIEILDW